MQDYLRCDAVEQLHHAWRQVALGVSGQVNGHIRETLDLLDHAVEQRSASTATLTTVRSYLESARCAIKHSDSLGVVLALVAALQELEYDRGKE